MIEAVWDPSDFSLFIKGHADDSRVCAGVSLLSAILFVDYGADRLSSGHFVHKFPMTSEGLHISKFVVKALKTLQAKYPGDILLTEKSPCPLQRKVS